MGQRGFFDLERRLNALSAEGDPLETITATVPWEVYRGEIEAVTGKKATERKSSARGRCPCIPGSEAMICCSKAAST